MADPAFPKSCPSRLLKHRIARRFMTDPCHSLTPRGRKTRQDALVQLREGIGVDCPSCGHQSQISKRNAHCRRVEKNRWKAVTISELAVRNAYLVSTHWICPNIITFVVTSGARMASSSDLAQSLEGSGIRFV